MSGDGKTWQERRRLKLMFQGLEASMWAQCPDHGRQAIDPFTEELLMCGCIHPLYRED